MIQTKVNTFTGAEVTYRGETARVMGFDFTTRLATIRMGDGRVQSVPARDCFIRVRATKAGEVIGMPAKGAAA